MRRFLYVTLLAFCCTCSTRAADTLQIAAAADLVFCLDALNVEFKKTHPGVELKLSTGSSGNFFAQIQNGAPFDVLLSADVKYPRELVKAGLAQESSLFTYAVGRIVLWTTRPDLDVKGGLNVVRSDAVKKFAKVKRRRPLLRDSFGAVSTAGASRRDHKKRCEQCCSRGVSRILEKSRRTIRL